MSRHYVPALVLGLLVTLGLFWLMQSMILNSQTGFRETNPFKMVEFVRLTRENQVKTRKRTLPETPPSSQKPPPPTMEMAKANPVKTAAPQIDMPNLDIPAGLGRMGGSLVGGLEMGTGGISTDLVPIFRIPPEYPMRARKRGVEGWVRIEFTIDKQGHVVNPIVVESNPSSTFNRNAIKAISKWKFKPKIIGGIAVEQRAVQVMGFKLDK